MPNNQPPPTPSQATPSASTTPPRRAAGSAQPTLGELIARISENISALVRGEIDLAKAKGQRMAKEMGLGAGLLGAAGVLALFIFGLLLGAMTAALSNVMPLWAAFLVVALILTVIAVPMVATLFERGAFDAHFGSDATDLGQIPASEDFSIIPDALGVPYTYWGVGGFADWENAPGNHSPTFAPDLQPTLDRAAEAMIVAAAAWLVDEDEG